MRYLPDRCCRVLPGFLHGIRLCHLHRFRLAATLTAKWLSAFLESYRPPLDGERYLTDREVAELLRVSRRTLQEYRNNRVLPFILLGGKVLYPESGLRELLEANYRKPL